MNEKVIVINKITFIFTLISFISCKGIRFYHFVKNKKLNTSDEITIAFFENMSLVFFLIYILTKLFIELN